MHDVNQFLLAVVVLAAVLVVAVGLCLSVLAGYWLYRRGKELWESFRQFSLLPAHTKALGLASASMVDQIVKLRKTVQELAETLSSISKNRDSREEETPPFMKYDEDEADLTVGVMDFMKENGQYDKETARQLVADLGVE